MREVFTPNPNGPFEDYDGILNAVAALSHAVRACNMRSNLTIELSKPMDGWRLLQYAQRRYGMTHGLLQDRPVEALSGKVFMQVEIVGVTIRWPAEREARRSGGFDYR
jgi:hypothetical protein